MKILVISDSYGYLDVLTLIFNEFVSKIDAVIHLGDCCQDLNIFKQSYSHIAYYEVLGNSERNPCLPHKLVVKLANKKLICVHGHRYGVKTSYDRIFNVASKEKADIFLFGHTLAPAIFYYDTSVFLTPGSIATTKRIEFSSLSILDISENGEIKPSIYFIKDTKFIKESAENITKYY